MQMNERNSDITRNEICSCNIRLYSPTAKFLENNILLKCFWDIKISLQLLFKEYSASALTWTMQIT